MKEIDNEIDDNIPELADNKTSKSKVTTTKNNSWMKRFIEWLKKVF